MRTSKGLQFVMIKTVTNFIKVSTFVGFVALFTGCAHQATDVFIDTKITSPKVIAMDAPRTPWVVEIESRLRKEGFRVLRWSSQKAVQEQTSETRKESYREASARYILMVRGYVNSDSMHRCFGGGFNFNDLTAELVDAQNNETILSISGSGYSENCPPMSGNLFGNIVNTVKQSWQE
jgi:hypothetical protein